MKNPHDSQRFCFWVIENQKSEDRPPPQIVTGESMLVVANARRGSQVLERIEESDQYMFGAAFSVSFSDESQNLVELISVDSVRR